MNAAAQSVDVIAAFEYRNYFAAAVPLGDPADLLGHVREPLFAEQEIAQGILPMSVESGGDEHQLGGEGIGGGENLFLEDGSVFGIARSGLHRQIQGKTLSFPSPSLRRRSGAGIERILVETDEQDGRIFLEDLLRAIPVVEVPVENQDAPVAMLLLGVSSRDGNCIEEAKPHCGIGPGMVAGRTNERKGVACLSQSNLIDRDRSRPHRQESSPKRVRTGVGISLVEEAQAVTRCLFHPPDLPVGVDGAEKLACRRHGLDPTDRVRKRGAEAWKRSGDPVRTLGVATRGGVPSKIGIRDKNSGKGHWSIRAASGSVKESAKVLNRLFCAACRQEIQENCARKRTGEKGVRSTRWLTSCGIGWDREGMTHREISLGHSPDSDDAFMFYALVAGKLDSGNLRFRQEVTDIETLNELAEKKAIDLTAVSIHAYGFLRKDYWLLPCGGSMGEGYGPRVVSPHRKTREELARSRIAIPGRKTSAVMALSLYLGVRPEELHLEVHPFDRILETVRSGAVQAGLVIHEGQLTYADEGLSLCVDLGQWWKAETGLPLPLGGNAVRKELGTRIAGECTRLLRESVRWGLEHRQEALAYASDFSRGLSPEKLDEFVEMYANERTFDYGPEGRRAIEEFLRQGRALGILPEGAGVDWVPE